MGCQFVIEASSRKWTNHVNSKISAVLLDEGLDP